MNLEKLNLVELDAQEVKSVEGGFLPTGGSLHWTKKRLVCAIDSALGAMSAYAGFWDGVFNGLN